MAFTVAAGGTDASSERLPYLDGWRGTAIAALLIGHFVSGFGDRPRFGMDFARLGVELFFVLSGLLMGNLLLVRKVSITTFYGVGSPGSFPPCTSTCWPSRSS